MDTTTQQAIAAASGAPFLDCSDETAMRHAVYSAPSEAICAWLTCGFYSKGARMVMSWELQRRGEAVPGGAFKWARQRGWNRA